MDSSAEIDSNEVKAGCESGLKLRSSLRKNPMPPPLPVECRAWINLYPGEVILVMRLSESSVTAMRSTALLLTNSAKAAALYT